MTRVLGTLQEAGHVSYSRGRVTIERRDGLEGMACECYAIIRQVLEPGRSPF